MTLPTLIAYVLIFMVGCTTVDTSSCIDEAQQVTASANAHCSPGAKGEWVAPNILLCHCPTATPAPEHKQDASVAAVAPVPSVIKVPDWDHPGNDVWDYWITNRDPELPVPRSMTPKRSEAMRKYDACAAEWKEAITTGLSRDKSPTIRMCSEVCAIGIASMHRWAGICRADNPDINTP